MNFSLSPIHQWMYIDLFHFFLTLFLYFVLVSFQLSIGIENGVLETYNSDFELQFSHQLKYIVGICKIATAQNALNGKSKLTEFITFPNRRPQSNVIDEANAKAGIHGIVYLLKNPRDPLLHVFLFESACLEQVWQYTYIKLICIFGQLFWRRIFFKLNCVFFVTHKMRKSNWNKTGFSLTWTCIKLGLKTQFFFKSIFHAICMPKVTS